jgi:hypothetical protein
VDTDWGVFLYSLKFSSVAASFSSSTAAAADAAIAGGPSFIRDYNTKNNINNPTGNFSK